MLSLFGPRVEDGVDDRLEVRLVDLGSGRRVVIRTEQPSEVGIDGIPAGTAVERGHLSTVLRRRGCCERGGDPAPH